MDPIHVIDIVRLMDNDMVRVVAEIIGCEDDRLDVVKMCLQHQTAYVALMDFLMTDCETPRRPITKDDECRAPPRVQSQLGV